MVITLAGPLWAGSEADVLARYQSSPLELHRELREAFTDRRDVRRAVERIRQEIGDHSFDSLLAPSEGKYQGFQLQALGWEAWVKKDYEEALARYTKAAHVFSRENAWSEASFSLYYAAEVCAEQQLFERSLHWLDRALALIRDRDCAYLEALILQSQGYSFWFLDDFQASMQAFSLALKRWRRIGYPTGITMTWANLAALYEDLRLWPRAQHSYRMALASSTASAPEEIRFDLAANYALFLHRRGRRPEARKELEQVRRLRHVSPQEFFLLECEILGPERRLQELLSWQPSLPSHRVEQALLLAGYFQGQGESEQTDRYLKRALDESRRNDLHWSSRRSLLRLGIWLEKTHRYREAARLYFQALERDRTLFLPEPALPYSRRVSPLFDGWIRSLIALGRAEQAWREIQRLAWLRREKARKSLQESLEIGALDDELALFGVAAKWEAGPPLAGQWNDLPALFSARPQGFVILEMWPEGRNIFAWVRGASGTTFRQLSLSREVAETVYGLVDPLYRASASLPPPPAPSRLQQLYASLWAPLEDLLDSRSLLFVGHKELQVFPIEMLQNERGEYLIERYDISYLPSAGLLPAAPQRSYGPPLLVAPGPVLRSLGMEGEERYLKSLFPEIQVAREMGAQARGSPRWVHISTHFRLDERFWWASGFDAGNGEVNLFGFLQQPWPARLISLGVCDAANSYSSYSPYWLGLSELLLARGTQAVVLSRWPMDGLSSGIYLNFYARCKWGLPMDEALSQAKRDFLGKSLRRQNHLARAAHPFFWAGITYVGLPGTRLYEPPGAAFGVLLRLSVCLLGLMTAICLKGFVSRR